MQTLSTGQADLFRQAGVDYLYAEIMPAVSEATGMYGVMEQTALPYEFNQTSLVRQRFRGIQANTTSLPPEKLDNSFELKYSGDEELA